MKTILAAVGFTDLTEHVVHKAAEFAKASGAMVWVMHAVADGSFMDGDSETPISWSETDSELPARFPEESRKLCEIVAALALVGVDAQPVLVSGPVVDSVIHVACEKNADLIVLGSHGHGAIHRMLAGTISGGVLRRADRPVLVVPSEMHNEPDGDRLSLEPLARAS